MDGAWAGCDGAGVTTGVGAGVGTGVGSGSLSPGVQLVSGAQENQ